MTWGHLDIANRCQCLQFPSLKTLRQLLALALSSSIPVHLGLKTSLHRGSTQRPSVCLHMCERKPVRNPWDVSNPGKEEKICSTGCPLAQGRFPITHCSWELSRWPQLWRAMRELRNTVSENDTLRMENAFWRKSIFKSQKRSPGERWKVEIIIVMKSSRWDCVRWTTLAGVN